MAGIIVGLLQIPALLIVGSPLGVSSSYVSASGYAASSIDDNIEKREYFEKYMTKPKYAWQGSMVVGIVLGAFVSMKLSGARRQSFSPIWKTALKLKSLESRSIIAFLGGFIMLFGARWAGGCTSGHGLSGVGQLAVSSIIVTFCFFMGGILVASLFRKI
jgi:uncharacterized membrane protein YedE/YeeE